MLNITEAYKCISPGFSKASRTLVHIALQNEMIPTSQTSDTQLRY